LSKIIIGDVHGCRATLEALINKLPHTDLVFAGDLIDRGPDSRGVISLVRKNGWDVIRGNHEDMAKNDHRLWMMNGGTKMIKQYRVGKSQGMDLYEDALDEDKDWLGSKPVYKLYDDVKDRDGRSLLVSHSLMLESYWKDLNTTKPIPLVVRHQAEMSIMWNRMFSAMDYDIKGIYNVFGHTPVKKAVLKRGRALIDTGACYGHRLTALQYPEMKIFYQDTLSEDKPKEQP
jgi:serine/threonine protein phosphatase 1